MPDPSGKMIDSLKVIDFMLCRKAVSSDSMVLNFNLRNQGNTNYYTVNAISGKCTIEGKIGYDASTAQELKDNQDLINVIGQVNYDDMQKRSDQNCNNKDV